MSTKEDFDIVLQDLHTVEVDLSNAVAAYPETPQVPYSRETLMELKGIVDRIRPLLWIYLNQASAAEAQVKTAVDDCLELTNKIMQQHQTAGESS